MPTAAEILAGLKARARTASRVLTLEPLDAVEQASRRNSPRTPTDVDKAWDEYVALERKGASQDEVDAAEKRYRKLSGQEN